jgi:type II secretory ATPase GspE/PulE/Tfp pilus assembly ATPase PilB-like protein
VVGEKAFERHILREGLVDEATLSRVRGEAASKGARLIDALVLSGSVTPEQVYRSLAAFCELRYVVPSKLPLSPDLARRVPARFATHYGFVPVEERNGTIVVALSDPLNAQLLDDIRLVLKQRIEAVVATPDEITAATKALYGVGADTVERILSDSESVASVHSLDAMATGTDLGDEKVDASIIKFVNELFAEAIKLGATDVHLEPFEDQLRVRFRVDGVLHAVPTPPSIRGFQPAIVSRIKIMATWNIAEKRLPQDGKHQACDLGDQHFDLRVSILPTPYGETVNIRLLQQPGLRLRCCSRWTNSVSCRRTSSCSTAFSSAPRDGPGDGPHGQRKRRRRCTRRCSKLNRLEPQDHHHRRPDRVPAQGHHADAGVSRRSGSISRPGLRSMLRHDPDIMMVGEIRDYETAQMADPASSLTGHLVFSDAPHQRRGRRGDAPVDMGVEPFLIASTMIASMAQRLVRRVCEGCGENPTSRTRSYCGASPDRRTSSATRASAGAGAATPAAARATGAGWRSTRSCRSAGRSRN